MSRFLQRTATAIAVFIFFMGLFWYGGVDFQYRSDLNALFLFTSIIIAGCIFVMMEPPK